MSVALRTLAGPDLSARAGIAAGAVVLLEGLLLVVVAGLIPRAVGAHGEIPSALAVLVVLGLGALFSFRLGETEVTDGRRWAVGVGVSIVMLHVVGRVDLSETARLWSFGWAADITDPNGPAWRGSERLDHVLGMAVLTFAWFRGVSLGNADLSQRSLAPILPLAVIIFGGGFLAADAAEITERVRITALAFLAVALLAVAFRNAQRLSSEGGFSTVGVTFLSTFGAMVVVALVFMLIVTLLVAVVGGTGIAEPVTEALGTVLRIVATGAAWVVWILLWPIRQLIGTGAEPFPPQPQCFVNETGELECFTEQNSGLLLEADEDGDSGAGTLAFRVLAGIGLIGGVAILAALLFRQVWRRQRPVDEERESLWSEADPFGDLWAGLRSLGKRLRPKRGPAPDRSIVGLYLEMLNDAERRGTERPAARTPLQFAPSLERLYRSALPGEISQRFMEQHYAGRDPAAVEVSRLRASWDVLRAAEPG
ncbi:MAG: hypothetical protein DK306_000486 [Chloroflexi bacterium]|nr:MAG: hypothetical protein DK306_000486 [Chloroflexota bacterium]